jgi:hypothetical protein
VRKGNDKRSFGDHVNWEMMLRDYIEKTGDDSLTVRFVEDVMEKQPF